MALVKHDGAYSVGQEVLDELSGVRVKKRVDARIGGAEEIPLHAQVVAGDLALVTVRVVPLERLQAVVRGSLVRNFSLDEELFDPSLNRRSAAELLLLPRCGNELIGEDVDGREVRRVHTRECDRVGWGGSEQRDLVPPLLLDNRSGREDDRVRSEPTDEFQPEDCLAGSRRGDDVISIVPCGGLRLRENHPLVLAERKAERQRAERLGGARR